MVDILKARGKRLKIGLFGLGKSNLGVLELLRSVSADFELTMRSDAPQSLDIGADRCFFGDSALKFIDEDVLFLSPSVRRDRVEFAEAQKRGTKISSDAELFFSLTASDVYSVTGSDGKSTTTYLISKFLTASGIPTVPAGNYGKSLCSLLNTDKTVAAELSSFQLQYLTPRSRSAVITNITPNHLNWHASLDEYAKAKMNITKHAERITADYDSELLRKAMPSGKLFAAVSLDNDYAKLKSLCNAENYLTFSKDSVYLNGSHYFDVRGAKRQEAYNVRNFMLAAAATLGEVSSDTIESVIKDFAGLPHRAERVADCDGITYINSSIDSTPKRTLKTLRALKGDTAVIICGVGKGLPLDELAAALPTLTVGAVLMGEIGAELSGLLEGSVGYAFCRADNMSEAIAFARSYLSSGGNLILSPAGTSFDNYKNFEVRGDDFRTAVLKYVMNNKDKE